MTRPRIDHRAVVAELDRRPCVSAVVRKADDRVQLLDADDEPIGPWLTSWDFAVIWQYDGDEAFAAVVEGARMAEERNQ